jgi:DNA-binding beta-propeller fold protein YncE
MRGPGIPTRTGRWAFDISWVDEASQMYFLADASNARVDLFDARTATYVGSIGGFTGFHGSLDTQGPAGLLTDNLYQLWVGDGNSTVKVIDLFSRSIVATLSIGGKKRADELAYDPQEQVLLVTNGSDHPAFASFISVTTRTIVGKVVFPDATGGLEAPTWDAVTHKFYLSVPATHQSPGGAVAVIDPLTKRVIRSYALSGCNPRGIATGPGLDLLLGCDGHPLILDRLTGRVVATIPQVNGCDEVWYNPGDHRYYLAAFTNARGPVLSVVDAESQRWITNIPTVPKAHSVAVDAYNNHIFVPLSGQGVAVYALTA